MPNLKRRSNSDVFYYYRRLPSDLVGMAIGHPILLSFPALRSDPARTVHARFGKSHVKFSYGTTDAHVAEQRQGLADAYLKGVQDQFRRGPQTLSQKQVVALSGEVYHLVVERFDDNPGTPDRWAAFKAISRATREGRLSSPPVVTPEIPDEGQQVATLIGAATTQAVNAMPANAANVPSALAQRYGALVDWVLAEKGLVVTDASRAALITAVDAAATDAAWRMKRAASGDYSPDPRAARFPEFVRSTPPTCSPPEAPTAAQETRKGGLTWDALITAWEGQHKARRGRASLRAEWRSRVMRFAEWSSVGPASITDDHVRKWRDRRLKEVTAVTTNADLMMIRTVYSHAISEKLLVGPNPADGIRVSGARRAAQRMIGFNDDEAALILAAAMRMSDYRKWVPLLSAFTGSRVSAVMNLRPCDVKQVSGYPVVEFSGEAGPLKTRVSERQVPIHATILDAGFLAFVAKRANEPRLFFDERRLRSKTSENPGKGRLNSLRRFLHGIEGVDIGRAKGKDPNHAWRHWLKTKLREAGVADSVSDGITGHAPGTEGAAYGGVSLKAMADALAKVAVPTVHSPTALPVAEGLARGLAAE